MSGVAATGGLVLRLVADGEHEAVDELVRVAYAHDYGVRDHGGDDPFRHSAHRAERSEVWVALDGDRLVGTVTIGLTGSGLMEDRGEDELDFRLLAVSPDARGRGIGEALTRLVIDRARAQGRAAVFMKSGPQMIGAHRLYERIGFRRDPDRDGLIRGEVKQFDLFAFVIDVDRVPATV